jgi:hypothetical protein
MMATLRQRSQVGPAQVDRLLAEALNQADLLCVRAL